jgi:hypothetical protein
MIVTRSKSIKFNRIFMLVTRSKSNHICIFGELDTFSDRLEGSKG